jgi:hypothetical protein
MNTAFFLEILNGGAVTPEWIWLAILAAYLSRESRRRGLHIFDWSHLPPSMNLILAVFIVDASVVTRSLVIWAWRRFDHAGDFGPGQTAFLVVSGFFIVVGTLCKIRALTYADYGRWPWLAACVVTLAGMIALIIF